MWVRTAEAARKGSTVATRRVVAACAKPAMKNSTVGYHRQLVSFIFSSFV